MSAKILLVEDEEALVDAIRLNLELEGYAVIVATTGTAALERFAEGPVDLVVLDVMLPEMNGFDVCSEIRRNDLRTPILFLTAKNNPTDRVTGLKLGGDDYLAKPFNLEEFLLRVQILVRRAAATREQAVELSSYRFGPNNISFASFEIQGANGLTKTLSKKEIGLLKLLIERKHEVVSRKEILDTVWGYDVYPSERTIDNFISNFRKYFEIDPKQPEYFHSVRGVGYKFTG